MSINSILIILLYVSVFCVCMCTFTQSSCFREWMAVRFSVVVVMSWGWLTLSCVATKKESICFACSSRLGYPKYVEQVGGTQETHSALFKDSDSSIEQAYCRPDLHPPSSSISWFITVRVMYSLPLRKSVLQPFSLQLTLT